MKLILLKDVKDVGWKNEVVEVSDGYAKNFLIPRGLAKIANPTSLAKREEETQAKVAKLKEEVLKLAHVKNELEAKEILITANADAKGNINGRVSSSTIATEIEKQTGHKVDKKTFNKKEITSFGTETVKIELFKGLVASVKITVRRA